MPSLAAFWLAHWRFRLTLPHSMLVGLGEHGHDTHYGRDLAIPIEKSYLQKQTAAIRIGTFLGILGSGN